MKILSFTVVGLLALVCGVALFAAAPQSERTQTAVVNPTRLIGFLPMGSVVELSFSDGNSSVKLLDKDFVEKHLTEARQLENEYKELTTQATGIDRGTGKHRWEELQSQAYKMSLPWKVVAVGDNYVRLEPISQLPFRVQSPWIILPESSIKDIRPVELRIGLSSE